MEPSSKRTLGIVIIVLSLLALAVGVYQIMPFAFGTISCVDSDVSSQKINLNTRIVYCISFRPLKSLYGRGIYDVGSTDQNEITVREINLKRDGQTLFVNNHALKVSEVYNTTNWTPSINPWVLFTRRFEIKNEGLLPPLTLSTLNDILFVSGDVYEGSFINPLGLVILGCGIWLLAQGKRELEQESTSTTKAG